MSVLNRRRHRTAQSDGSSLLDNTNYDLEKPKNVELQFKHWLITLLGVAVIYSLIVFQDSRMPDVVSSNDTKSFSEERARTFLNELTRLGPRPSGSIALEVKTLQIMTDRIKTIGKQFELVGVNRLSLDVQKPSGCFNLQFLTPFSLCYHKITNVVVRIGSKSKPSNHAVLLNCHLDTLPDTPGATDDAVSCAITMEVLEVLSRRKTPLENDIIFLFNGAEENFLQASHGFITQHRWRHDVRAFINLEGTGSGGREILFQAGPGDSWILETYLQHAPNPHCSVLAQEIFQMGIIPSDTDFRILRDFGRLSGLDIAYHRNGWVYHTEFDKADAISTGSIQRAGENVLAVTEALVRSPHLEKPTDPGEFNKWVFYDFVGLFTVRYKAVYGQVVNYFVICAVIYLILTHLRILYSFSDLCSAVWHHIMAFLAMTLTGICIMMVVKYTGLTMSWYALPELVFPLYILPMVISGCFVHSTYSVERRGNSLEPHRSYKPLVMEAAHYDVMLVYWSLILFLMTASGLASSFFMFYHVFFPALRDPMLTVYKRVTGGSLTPHKILIAQWICLLPVISLVSYAVMLFFDFFVPVMGRFGNLICPEYLMMPLSLITASTFVLFTSNLVYLSRPMKYFFKAAIAFSVLGFLIIATTRIGNPYKWSDDGLPRLRRLLALHTKRTVYGYEGELNSSVNGLFIQSFDYRGVDDLPEHTFLQGNDRPDCSNTEDQYCQLPYYTAMVDLLPPESSRWVRLPTEPNIVHPLSVELLGKEYSNNGRNLNISVIVRGGVDKLSLHITPLNGFRLTEFSFTKVDQKILGKRKTYFVFLTYGSERISERRMWFSMERNSDRERDVPSLELAVATHQAHGPQQNSPTLLQLRSLINSRRKTPHMAVGFWKWGITMIGGTSELISHLF